MISSSSSSRRSSSSSSRSSSSSSSSSRQAVAHWPAKGEPQKGKAQKVTIKSLEGDLKVT